MSDAQTDYAISTLEQTPGRVLVFLRAAGTSPEIRALLAARGYTNDDHDEGWSLLHKVSGVRPTAPPPAVDTSVRDAVNELDNWDEDGYRLVAAALTRKHPEQARFVLDGLGPEKGAGAVLSVKNLLDRLDQLESSPERKTTRKADKAALESLAKKGITAEERTRLRKVVETAQGSVEIESAAAQPDQATGRPSIEDLKELRAWYDEWTETAKVAIKRRDHLIRLGLAKRRTKKQEGVLPEKPGLGVRRRGLGGRRGSFPADAGASHAPAHGEIRPDLVGRLLGEHRTRHRGAVIFVARGRPGEPGSLFASRESPRATGEMQMSELIQKRIDFVLFFDVQDGNPNGDPDAGNMPRVDAETGHGLVTDVCLKRHIRNFVTLTRGDAAGYEIYVKDRGVLNAEHGKAYKSLNLVLTEPSEQELPVGLAAEIAKKLEETGLPEGFSLKEGDDEKTLLVYSGDLDEEGKKEAKKELKKVHAELGKLGAEMIKKNKSRKASRQEVMKAEEWMCKQYFDIRTFGAVMGTSVNCGQVRGPVQMTFARSIEPIFAVEHAITRVAVTKEQDQEKKQTEMGRKSTVRYALYRAYGFISPALAAKSKFSQADQTLLFEALAQMFEHSRSSSKGLMATRALVLFEHEDKLGSAPAHELFENSVQVRRVTQGPAQRFSDYEIKVAGEELKAQQGKWLVRRKPGDEGYALERCKSPEAP